jgi:hypothetical protein
MPTTPQTGPRPALDTPHLPLARYRLDFRTRDHITLPPFQGAVWRSVFGLALKTMSDEASAHGTSALGVYTYLFETPPPPGAAKLKGSNAAPHPFVIGAEPNFEPRHFAPNETLTIELTLIGRGNVHAPVIFEAFARGAGGGLAKSRGRAELTEVSAIWRTDEEDTPLTPAPDGRYAPAPAKSPAIPPMPDIADVHLLTPLRLVRDGRPLRPRDFHPGDLLRALLRRISMLMSFHTDADLETDFRTATALSHQARMAEAELEMASQTRYSRNHSGTIPMDGLVGGFLLDMRGLEGFWPYLWLGQWVHAGKGTVMGNGALHIREAVDF